jgi:hypothetical protein
MGIKARQCLAPFDGQGGGRAEVVADFPSAQMLA